ncbi:VOC family protein [Corynebacterium sp. A21]|uniref:VOC family protein n=1 Tax=Corynebacterium sp. A21 TaxID=3457318 RepID=UPI003FD3D538
MTNRADHNIWPLLTSNDALALLTWLQDLGFEKGVLIAEGELVQHSEMLWPEGGRLMISSARPELVAPGIGGSYIVTDYPDEVHSRAVAMGAKISSDLQDTDYGSRDFSLSTPDGHELYFGTYAGELQ